MLNIPALITLILYSILLFGVGLWIMATKDRSARIKGAFVAMSWTAIVFSGMAILGLSGRVIFGDAMEPENVFFSLSDDLLPGILGGVVAAGMLSAIMSTVDSQLLVAGGAVSHDLGLGKRLGGREVLVTRLAIVAVCVVAVILTLGAPASIFERVLFAYVSLGAAFGPVVIARALGFRPSGSVVLAGMCTGFLLAVLFESGWVGTGPNDMLATTAPWVGAAIAMAIVGRARQAKTVDAIQVRPAK